jgi:hypothetical protein
MEQDAAMKYPAKVAIDFVLFIFYLKENGIQYVATICKFVRAL